MGTTMSFAIDPRTRRLLRAIMGGLVGRVVILLAPFIVMPAMLRSLGDLHFGIWMTAVAFTSMALFADLGIGNGLLTRLSGAFGRGDKQSIRSDISSAYATLSTVALGLAALGALALFALGRGMADARGWEIDDRSIAIIAASLGAFVLGIPANIIQRVMYAEEKVVQANLWQIGGAALSVATAFGAINLRASPAQIVLSYAVASPLVLILSSVWYFSKHRDIAPRVSEIAWPAARDLMRLGSRFLLLSVLTSIAMNADNLIIAARVGPDAVTAYAIPAKVASLLALVITVISLPMWSANGQAIAQGDFAWVQAKARKMAFVGATAIAIVGLTLALAGNIIINLWADREFAGQQHVLLAFAFLYAAMALASPFHMILNSVGIIRVQIYSWGLFAFFTLPLKYFFADEKSLFLFPTISFFAYFVIILPASYFSSKRYIARQTA